MGLGGAQTLTHFARSLAFLLTHPLNHSLLHSLNHSLIQVKKQMTGVDMGNMEAQSEEEVDVLELRRWISPADYSRNWAANAAW